MAYNAYVTTLKNVRKHPNADRLQLGECFGNTVCVSLDYYENQIGVYFPTDGQLSEEFCAEHNLVRRKDDAGNNIGGYMDPIKRNVTSIRLRGEKSDGLFMPISCLDYCYDDRNAAGYLSVGDVITVVNGHEICTKYIPRRRNQPGAPGSRNKNKVSKVSIAPTFYEHVDTEQLAYNLSAFKPGDQIEITLKMHGTSQRTGYLPTIVDWYAPGLAWDILERKFIFRLFKPTKKMIDWAESKKTPTYDWGYVSGTRRTVLEDYQGGYYGSNAFREQHSKTFEGKLWKGETVYYEVVGFTDTGAPIMATADNKKLNDKEFIKQYGKETVFSYGCHPNGWNDKSDGYNLGRCEPQSDIYVYRMTMTNEDGQTVEYTPEFMRYRCEQMGVKTVPVFFRGFIPDEEVFTGVGCEFTDPGEWVRGKAEEYYDGPDPVGKTHVREGVVVRILNRPKFAAYKHKNFSFKVLEGICKAEATAPDIEEAEEVIMEEGN